MLLSHSLYLPSTPLNILLSVVHASNNSTLQSATVCFIDQKSPENIYFKILSNWKESPFKQTLYLTGKQRGLKKLKERKEIFEEISRLINDEDFTDVFVGSDRRVEFQFAMHVLASKCQTKVRGHYLDDGLYSYAGRPHHPIKDTVNGFLKKLFYGLWWKEPKTVGASSWITDAWLFAPDKAVVELQAKQLHSLNADMFLQSHVKIFVEKVVNAFHVNLKALQDADYIILIAHPNNILKMEGYQSKMQRLILKLKRNGKKVIVKYHPRTKDKDPIALMQSGAEDILPATLAFEFCLPILKPSCVVIGDVGTSLLTAKWLRNDLQISAILDETNSFQRPFISLSQKMGIEVLPSIDSLQGSLN